MALAATHVASAVGFLVNTTIWVHFRYSLFPLLVVSLARLAFATMLAVVFFLAHATHTARAEGKKCGAIAPSFPWLFRSRFCYCCQRPKRSAHIPDNACKQRETNTKRKGNCAHVRQLCFCSSQPPYSHPGILQDLVLFVTNSGLNCEEGSKLGALFFPMLPENEFNKGET